MALLTAWRLRFVECQRLAIVRNGLQLMALETLAGEVSFGHGATNVSHHGVTTVAGDFFMTLDLLLVSPGQIAIKEDRPQADQNQGSCS